jgi:aspartyl-tRNA(Asn)/glutamyl-tRNA(Gln) amidotransferase subunit A
MSELCWLSAAGIGAAYAARRLSPVELVRALLDQASTHDGQLNAFIHLDADAVMRDAQTAERELMSGKRRSPLHGVPIAIKDIVDVAGDVTTCHSRVMLDSVAAAEDAGVITRLREAGAILFGKTSLHEFAIGGPAFDLPFPPARNPWNRDHHPGGSSSGAGAALAAGMVPLALGTDTGGSIRNPAGACGLVGLKPTYGLVSRRGAFPLSFTLDHLGPLSRTVTDAALSLEAMAGHDARDPSSARQVPGIYSDALEQGLRGLRVGYVRHFHERDMQASPEVAASLDAVAALLRQEGAEVRDIELPPLHHFAWPQRVIFHAEAWAVHSQWLCSRPDDYAGISRRKLLAGAFLDAGDYVQAQQSRTVMIEAVNRALREVDVLLTVNSADTPCRIDDADEAVRTYSRHARSPFNLTGHPAMALMCGLSDAGLPLSMQLVGRPFDEATLLRAARAYERATPWHAMHPPRLAAAALQAA